MIQTFVFPLIGGIVIGLSAVGLLLTHGKIAGVSGITKGLFGRITMQDRWWRIAFLGGLILGGGCIVYFTPEKTAQMMNLSFERMVIAGMLVGMGTSLGNGCTSGHGVCGLGRKSKRSLLAVVTFLMTAFVTMYLFTHIFHLPRI